MLRPFCRGRYPPANARARGMRALATALLAGLAPIFIAPTGLVDQHPAWGFVRAFAEAGLVGGIADWFAVTALFRHPLGIPIPHTAVVRERKDQFAATLGGFVQQHFPNADVVAERLGEAIKRMHHNAAVSALFTNEPGRALSE